jgi:formylglycine-generating enzyme required for sulfatase activity
VTVSTFRIAITPVTAGLYAEAMGKQRPAEDKAQLPAVDISWFDAIDFCNALSERQGYRPCYRRDGRQVVCDWQADGYRLPTEAEWEYACRAGTTTRYAFGDDPAQLERYAWFGKEVSEGPFVVAQKLPNSWGLYDMHGNVWEWCWDWYGPYDRQSLQDPHGHDEALANNRYRVVRGGSFGFSPGALRSAFRDLGGPENRDWDVGFRCVRVPPGV